MSEPLARIIAVQDDIVMIEAAEGGKLMKNEVVYVCPARLNSAGRQERLKGEVLRIRGRIADVQVFEDTGGVAVGDTVEQSSEMLSVQLGPGLLGQVYDGLQNPLEKIAVESGFFLPRGSEWPALDANQRWSFQPSVRMGDKVDAGDELGTVQEGRIAHKILAPFDLEASATVTWVQEGAFSIDTVVARLETRLATGEEVERPVKLHQFWPVRRPIPSRMLKRQRGERLYPSEPLLTSIRIIDSFFPIARGGTGCIPGPFGAGKTVLQNLIARYAEVDVVVIVACGERAGEVVETITKFPELADPHGGGSLMDRTVIICNTSSMPVAAREASIYTGITIGEYYRQMGLDVLLIADSTSRWAQAMRETSGRMEEIPGEEAFPAYLDSAIRSVYERAGVIRTPHGDVGSLTMIGTVSPAGGNFEEPVTQSTLGTVKTFLGLSADRAYKRFYPAVDPLLSWSRYHEQLKPWYAAHTSEHWAARIQGFLSMLERGEEIYQMMQVTGEEGISMDDFIDYQKALFIDMVYLQQDAYDEVDVSTPLQRQEAMLALIDQVLKQPRTFKDKDGARDFYTGLTGLFKNLNYSAEDSPQYRKFMDEIRQRIGA